MFTVSKRSVFYTLWLTCLIFSACRDGFKLRFIDHSDIPLNWPTDSAFHFKEENYTILSKSNKYYPVAYSRIKYNQNKGDDFLELYLPKDSFDNQSKVPSVITVYRKNGNASRYPPKSCDTLSFKGKSYIKLSYERMKAKETDYKIYYYPSIDSVVRLY